MISPEPIEDNKNNFGGEARRIKSSMSAVWEKKLHARKNAYWGYVRNGGNNIVKEIKKIYCNELK